MRSSLSEILYIDAEIQFYMREVERQWWEIDLFRIITKFRKVLTKKKLNFVRFEEFFDFDLDYGIEIFW